MKRRFIEYDLPLAEISEHSAHETNVHIGRPNQFHVWWARRTLAASRATIFAALVRDPGAGEAARRKRLAKLIAGISNWNSVKDGNSPDVIRARELVQDEFDEPPVVVDPFSGGGTIPFEALRLGAKTLASDYNPVAVLLEKATIEWPNEFDAEVLLSDKFQEGGAVDGGLLEKDSSGATKQRLLLSLVQRWGRCVLDKVELELGDLFPAESSSNLVGKNAVENLEGWIPVSYIWARTVPCQKPSCPADVPLLKNYWLAKKSGKRIALHPRIDKEECTIRFEVLGGENLKAAQEHGFDPSNGTTAGSNAECPVCDQVIKAKQVRELARTGSMGERLVAVVLYHPDERGKKYRTATISDKALTERARERLQSAKSEWPYLDSPLPDEPIPEMSGTFNVPLYGMDQWKKMFNARQRLVLLTFVRVVRESYSEIRTQCEELCQKHELTYDPSALANAVIGYLGLLVDRQADFCARTTTWLASSELVKHVFTRGALKMATDYAEVNPFSGSSGSFETQLYYLTSSLEKFFVNESGDVCVYRSSATDLPLDSNAVDAVITDPPYYNNVPYADLSDFFYVWLKRSIGEFFPELFSTPLTPKTEEACEMAGWDSERYGHKDAEFFEDKLTAAFKESYRVLRPSGIAVFVYAHKTTEGWETMLNGLVEAGFVVTASWPIHTEMKVRLRAARSAALASSIYMVCRKFERESVGFWNDIQQEIKDRVEEKLEQFWNAGIAGGDFFISAIGPGMEAYSRYEDVQTYDGETVSVLDLLQFIRGVATDFLVHRLLKDASAEALEKEAQFYLTYRWTFMDNKVEFDDARKIASAEGVDLEPLWDDDGFIKKTRKYIYVHGPQDRKEIKSIDNMVDAMHVACKLWEKGDKEGLDQMLKQTGYGKTNAFWQLCQAVAECYVNGNKEKQLLEGLLLGKEKHMKAVGEGQTELL